MLMGEYRHAMDAKGRLFMPAKLREDLGEKYLKLYCKKTDTAMQHVQKWMPIIAASQSIKRKDEEKELLHRWIDVVEYE